GDLPPAKPVSVDLRETYLAVEDHELVVDWRIAAPVVNELLHENARVHMLVLPFAGQLVVAPMQPLTAFRNQRLPVELPLVPDEVHPARTMGRLYDESIGQRRKR